MSKNSKKKIMFLNFLIAHLRFSISDFETLLQSRLIFFHVKNDPDKRPEISVSERNGTNTPFE